MPSGVRFFPGRHRLDRARSLAGGAVVDHLSIASMTHFGGLLAMLSLLVIMTFSTRHASLKHVLDK
ncbi:hypothetical protein [Paraburkholderia sp. BL6665CI2N2]|uniref:hypothetical protein n=1 Tax=Paraburkholderia sp. BL6665CI2N2 TaxID=1938806 RepID=UPI001AB043C4|nr:hypothetical protein [Paraburkholderia sp. BL6665CI2N2]